MLSSIRSSSCLAAGVLVAFGVVKLLGGRVQSFVGVVKLVGDTEQAVAVTCDC